MKFIIYLQRLDFNKGEVHSSITSNSYCIEYFDSELVFAWNHLLMKSDGKVLEQT